MNEQRQGFVQFLRSSWFSAGETLLGLILITALAAPLLYGLNRDVQQLKTLEARIGVLERNAAIDAIPDAVLMENPDYQDSIDVVTLMASNPHERSARWPAVARQHLKTEWWCRGCGCTNKLQIHHKLPFHIDATHELDDANLITLCMWSNRCHFVKGHLGNWKDYNTNIVHDAHVAAPR